MSTFRRELFGRHQPDPGVELRGVNVSKQWFQLGAPRETHAVAAVNAAFFCNSPLQSVACLASCYSSDLVERLYRCGIILTGHYLEHVKQLLKIRSLLFEHQQLIKSYKMLYVTYLAKLMIAYHRQTVQVLQVLWNVTARDARLRLPKLPHVSLRLWKPIKEHNYKRIEPADAHVLWKTLRRPSCNGLPPESKSETAVNSGAHSAATQ
ncbi:hypothetical protein B566_EDAN001237 [Ephemera danica]|nr:hypothetical protein B566_EDAN001237 [Ephemera danica]